MRDLQIVNSIDKAELVEDMGFSLRRGQALGIVGESGSGKSTLGRVVAGLVTPTGGSLTLPEGSGLSAAGQPHHGGVQIVLQESANALDPRMRVDRAIAEALAGSGAKFVDVNSGVESAPGVKDHAKMEAFFKALA